MIVVKKIRKNMGNTQFILMEKTVDYVEQGYSDQPENVVNTEESLRSYIDLRISEISPQQTTIVSGQEQPQQQAQTQIVQFSEEALELSKEGFLGIIANDPIDGNILEYNGLDGSLIWGQKYDPTEISENIESINGLIEEIQDLLNTHTHIADQIYGGTFPDPEYSFANEIRATAITCKSSGNSDKYSIQFNSVTNSLDITYVG